MERTIASKLKERESGLKTSKEKLKQAKLSEQKILSVYAEDPSDVQKRLDSI